jgi:uroporphyrinogen-III synthase
MSEQSKPLSIFSSRILPDSESERLVKAGFRIRQKDFITVKQAFDTDRFTQRINNPDTQARVFTSKNAVRSLATLLKDEALSIDRKKTFTVGLKATEMLKELGVDTSARAGHALALAQIIARNSDVDAVDFFCGNMSLDDLPEYLENKGVRVHKEIVYHTEMVQHEVETASVHGLIFLSPSAVYSFFKKNHINPETPCFCIGATTSEAIHLRCDNPRIPSNEPTLTSVIDKVIEYFKDQH